MQIKALNSDLNRKTLELTHLEDSQKELQTEYIQYKTKAESDHIQLSTQVMEQVKVLERLKKENDENDKLMFHLRAENQKLTEQVTKMQAQMMDA